MSASTVKTAISIEGSLLREAQSVARRMKVSRSRLIATATKEYIERLRNQELLRAIDAAHAADAGPEGEEEKRLRRSMQRQHRRLVKGQW
jgi:metal-responsive CopG/Arc/MetJ family transcriptional regulator